MQYHADYTVKGRYSITVDEVTRDILILCQTSMVSSTMIRMSESGNSFFPPLRRRPLLFSRSHRFSFLFFLLIFLFIYLCYFYEFSNLFLGPVKSKTIIPYCLSGIVVHGSYVYAITQRLAHTRSLFLQVDTDRNSSK